MLFGVGMLIGAYVFLFVYIYTHTYTYTHIAFVLGAQLLSYGRSLLFLVV